jgi:acetolactate synthase-1/2/3 large subunit
MNNNFLGMVRQWQQLFFNRRYSSTELKNPDFLMIAKGYGIKGKHLSKREHLDDAINEMLEHDGPFLLEVKVRKEGNVFPMVPAGMSVSNIRLE